MNNVLTVNDFFCGAGGMGLGFQQAGYEIVGAWDYDKYAVQSYAANVGAHVVQADITKMVYTDIPKATVWTFGFPCQDLSVAGKAVGIFEGKRSGLFFEVMRLLEETATCAPENLPAVIVAENVKGLKPYLEVLRAEYEKAEYIMHFQLFNSKYWDVPQNRERYFVVGVRADLSVDYEYPVEITTNVPKLSSFLDPVVDEKYYIDDEKAKLIIAQALEKLDKLGTAHATLTPARVDKRQRGPRAKEEEEPMFTLTAQDLHGVIVEEPAILRAERTEYGKEIRRQYEAGEVKESWGNIRKLKPRPDGITNTLTTVLKDKLLLESKIQCLTNCNPSGNGMNGNVFGTDGLAPTLTTNKGEGIKIVTPCMRRVRRLTPTEYGRLQAFPMDTWKQVVSNSQAYKQFGNAVTVTVAKAVAESIKRVLI